MTGPGTIRITSLDVKVSFLNRGPRSRGTGDVLLIRQLLFNKGIRKAPLGHADLVCTYTGPRARQCSGTYSLPRGKIVVAGSLRFRAFFKLAVVGGTELYDNVRGSLTATKYTKKAAARDPHLPPDDLAAGRRRRENRRVASVKDPWGAEARALAALGDFDGKRVLEIGCGDGRLTLLYAEQAAEVLGIDPEEESIREARRALPDQLKDRVEFRVADVQALDVPRQRFDIAFLSWSL